MIVSAVIADGPPRRLLEVIADGAAELVLPKPVVVEVRRILNRKLGLGEQATDEILELLSELAVEVPSVPRHVQAVSGNPDDDQILAVAVAAGAEILISGDAKHLLPLGRHEAVRIIRPQAFLAEIGG